jgi:hypothetical protein
VVEILSTHLAPLSIAIKYWAKTVFIPIAVASTTIYVTGIKTPKENKKFPKTDRENASSVKGMINSRKEIDFGRGGSLDLMVMLAMVSIVRMINAEMRIAHPNPTWTINLLNMIGNIIPPILDPVTKMPKAAARFLSK